MAARNGCSLNWGGLDRAVNTAAQKLADRKKLMNSVGEALVSGTLGRFESEESPEGEAWTPSHRAASSGGKTLADTADLKRSIDYATTSDTVMVGSVKEYAPIHHYGGTITPKKGKYLKFMGSNGKPVFVKKVTIPARPFIGVSKADMEEVKATLQDFLEGAFSQ